MKAFFMRKMIPLLLVYTLLIPTIVQNRSLADEPQLVTYNYQFKKLGLTVSDAPTKIEGDRLVNMSFNTFAKTTAGDPAEINPAIPTDPWYYYGEGPSTKRLYYYVNTFVNAPNVLHYWPSGLSDDAKYFQLAIRVNKTGNYRAIPAISYVGGGGIYELFIAPISAVNKMDSKYSMGKIDTYRSTAMSAPEEVTLSRIVALTAGDFVATYKFVGKNPSQSGVTVFTTSGLTLSETSDLPTNGELRIKIDEFGAFTVGGARTTRFCLVNQYGEELTYHPEDVTVTTENELVATAQVMNEKINNLLISGIGAGETNLHITINSSFSETPITCILPIRINANTPWTGKNYSYNFFRLSSRFVDSTRNAIQPSQVTRLAQTRKGNPDEIYPTSSQLTDPWCYDTYSGAPVNINFDPNNSYGYGIILDTGTGTPGWIRFKIEVGADGLYQVVSQNSLYFVLGITELFLAPVNAENPLDNNWSVGTFDAYRIEDATLNSENWVKECPLNARYLKAGEYYLTYKIKSTRAPANTYRLFFSALKLNYLQADLSGLSFTIGAQPSIKEWTDGKVPLSLLSADGKTINPGFFETQAQSSDSAVFTPEIVREEMTSVLIKGVSEGSAMLTVTLLNDGITVADGQAEITISPSGTLTDFKFFIENYQARYIPLSTPLTLGITLYDQENEVIPTQTAPYTVVYRSQNPEIAEIKEGNVLVGKTIGNTIIYADVTLDGVSMTREIPIGVTEGKSARTIFTDEKVQNARSNISKYGWARSQADSYTARAAKYVALGESICNYVTTQQLPRCITVGYRRDPNAYLCRFCGADIRAKYGAYGWTVDAIRMPFKIQCPDCKRKFPSNDFESFYEAGIDENGNWNYEKAKANGGQYLINISFTKDEVRSAVERFGGVWSVAEWETPNADGLCKWQTWGVDDGYGYKTGKMSGEVQDVHTYIAYYNHFAIWHEIGLIPEALNTLHLAYIYTGNMDYARVGAVLLDRVADIYPDFNLKPYYPNFSNSDSSLPNGKTVGCIWECSSAKIYARSYDAFYDAFEDQSVIDYVSQKAAEYHLENPKTSGALIRQNCEDGILREIYTATKRGDIWGNFGMHQSAVVTAAVALDTMPETMDMIDWIMKSGDWNGREVVGGNLLEQLVSTVDRDGMGNESSPQYNNIWLNNLVVLADVLAGYKGYEAADLYKNPKFIKMMTAMIPLTLCRRATAQIGDAGRVASTTLNVTLPTLVKAFQNTGNIKVAQFIYLLLGRQTENVTGDIFTADAGEIEPRIRDAIEQHGEYNWDESTQATGYGFSIIRDGTFMKNAGTAGNYDTQRDFWLYYGAGKGHRHPDGLNLGMSAFGLNFAPDLGYPQAADGSDPYTNWSRSTLSHNTVMVNATKQAVNSDTPGTPLHFDSTESVKVMDVSMPKAYNTTSIYRRTIVMVKVSDEISYGVDFFHVKGGNDHLYSFHALSNTIKSYNGFSPIKQVNGNGEYVGSYAGPTVPYGTTGSTSGFAWLKNIEKDMAPPSGKKEVDFKITDFRNTLRSNLDLGLKMTMLNDFDLSEMTISDGIPAQIEGNPTSLKYIIARRNGTNLNSLFTTVYQPYKNNPYITEMVNVAVTRADGAPILSEETVKAVKIKSEINGIQRTDYIIYAQDNSIQYVIDGAFEFRGFVGVCSVEGGQVNYAYINDGTLLGEMQTTSAFTGKVSDFNKDMSFSNYISIIPDYTMDIEKIVGRYIYIENDRIQNAVYKIERASQLPDGRIKLDIGDVTLIRKTKDTTDFSKGFVYNIESGQNFRIPLSSEQNFSPVFERVSDKYVEVFSKMEVKLNAKSPMNKPLTFRILSLPRGATFDPNTMLFSWTPEENQVGTYSVVIEVNDGELSSTCRFTITVGTASGSVLGGAFSGGGEEVVEEKIVPEPVLPTQRFSDLNGFEWATEAINSLAAEGIIYGTTAATFSPASNIKRGDFVLLLVRALKLNGGTVNQTVNFDDVEEGTYYSDSIKIAHSLGFVTGHNGNFYPENPITRQDLMVIIFRAFMRKEPSCGLEKFSDVMLVSEYARQAVQSLVADGIVTGSGDKLNPLNFTTRAEVAQILYRILNL